MIGRQTSNVILRVSPYRTLQLIMLHLTSVTHNDHDKQRKLSVGAFGRYRVNGQEISRTHLDAIGCNGLNKWTLHMPLMQFDKQPENLCINSK